MYIAVWVMLTLFLIAVVVLVCAANKTNGNGDFCSHLCRTGTMPWREANCMHICNHVRT